MIQIIKQLYFRYKELINYVIVGGLTTVVSLASYYFFTARISTLLIEMACMTLLVNILHWNDRISKFAVQFIVMALNYIFSKLFVFRIKE